MARKRKASAPEHRLQAGDKHIAGYQKGDRLTDWHGKDMGWRVSRSQKSFYNSDTDQQYYTVVFYKELRKLDRDGDFVKRYLSGISMGEGMLFRGETSANWDRDEAQEAAESVAEYWAGVDEQDAIKDREEQEREDRNEGEESTEESSY